jgi:threonine/homoserine/homoserine lactone efflux protein
VSSPARWRKRRAPASAASCRSNALRTSASLFWRGLFSNLFNPKSMLFFISVVPGFIQYDPSGSGLPVQAAWLGAVYIAITTATHAGIVLLASRLRPVLIAGSRRKSVRRVLSFALVLVAVWLGWSTRRA